MMNPSLAVQLPALSLNCVHSETSCRRASLPVSAIEQHLSSTQGDVTDAIVIPQAMPPVPVALDGCRLIVGTHSKTEHAASGGSFGLEVVPVEVPLFLSEVGCVSRGASRSTLVVVVWEAMQSGNYVSERRAWLIDVAGDSDDVLLAFGEAGAIRTDFGAAFHVHEQIGFGACSTVYRASGIGRTPARCVTADFGKKDIAVKVIQSSSQDMKLMAEVEFLTIVQGHPNIIGFFGIFSTEEAVKDAELDVRAARRRTTATRPPPNWSLVMEYCEAGDVFNRITTIGAYQAEEARELVGGILSALTHIHARGIIHRDVKAENILLLENGRPLLADFGIAVRMSDAEDMKRACGSPGYAAPEMLMRRQYDEKIDLFGVGVVMYFALAGKLPFQGSDLASTLRKNFVCKVKYNKKSLEGIGESSKRLMAGLLERDPEIRLNAAEALQCLGQADVLSEPSSKGGELPQFMSCCKLPSICSDYPPVPAPKAPLIAPPVAKPMPDASASCPQYLVRRVRDTTSAHQSFKRADSSVRADSLVYASTRAPSSEAESPSGSISGRNTSRLSLEALPPQLVAEGSDEPQLIIGEYQARTVQSSSASTTNVAPVGGQAACASQSPSLPSRPQPVVRVARRIRVVRPARDEVAS